MELNASKLAKMRMKASYLSAGWSSVSEQEALRPQLPHHTDIAPDAAADDDGDDDDDDDDADCCGRQAEGHARLCGKVTTRSQVFRACALKRS